MQTIKEKQFTITTDISTATHWLSYEKNNDISLNKLYQLHMDYDPITKMNECFIKDDKGNYTMDYMRYKGIFIKFTDYEI